MKMQPQNPQEAAQTLAAMTGQQPPGPPGQQPPGPPGQPGPQAQPPTPPPPPPAPEQPTLDAKPEGDTGDDAVLYSFKVGDEEVSLTPEQTAGMYERYGKMLNESSQMKPFMKFGEQLMSKLPPGTDPNQAVQSLVTALTKNPQMGQQAPQQNPQSQPPQQAGSNADISEQLKRWETENATQLPPGYTDMLSSMQGVQGQFGQVQQMLQQVLAATAGQTDATRAGAVQNVQDATRNQKGLIKNNLDRVQSAMQMSDADLEPFLQFAQQRGYSIPEFADIELLANVVGDFKRAKDEPKMKLLETVANRRKAYTEEPAGTPGAAPGAAPGGPPGSDASALENMLRAKGL